MYRSGKVEARGSGAANTVLEAVPRLHGPLGSWIRSRQHCGGNGAPFTWATAVSGLVRTNCRYFATRWSGAQVRGLGGGLLGTRFEAIQRQDAMQVFASCWPVRHNVLGGLPHLTRRGCGVPGSPPSLNALCALGRSTPFWGEVPANGGSGMVYPPLRECPGAPRLVMCQWR